jgi:transcriptional regulator with XRE-family HTH domain
MTDLPEHTGDRIRRQRESLGWSQHDLARRAGVERSYITRLENGERFRISLEISVKIADALGVTVDYLARGEDTSSAWGMAAGGGVSGKVPSARRHNSRLSR